MTGVHACVKIVRQQCRCNNQSRHCFPFLSGIDTLTLHAKTPAFSSAPCALAFSPFASSSVVVVCADHTIAVVDAENGLPTEWTKNASALPQQWLSRKEKVVGVSFDPGAPTTAYLHDHSGFCVVDFAKPIPSPKARWVSFDSVTRQCVCADVFLFESDRKKSESLHVDVSDMPVVYPPSHAVLSTCTWRTVPLLNAL